MPFFAICLRSILAYRSSSNHDPDLVCNLQTRWSLPSYTKADIILVRSPFSDLSGSKIRLGEDDVAAIDLTQTLRLLADAKIKQ
jgi:hypothetical protein